MAVIHTVTQGECLASIARRYGIGDWYRIYHDASNAEFRRKRPNPHVIFPGDQINIPENEIKDQACATDQKHVFQLIARPTILRVRVEDTQGKALANKAYRLTLDRNKYEETTSGDGLIEKPVDPALESADLTVWLDDARSESVTWKLQLGHLDPIGELTGVQARLNNLGFDCGDEDGEWDQTVKSALMLFQARHGFEPTGDMTQETLQCLLEQHDHLQR